MVRNDDITIARPEIAAYCRRTLTRKLQNCSKTLLWTRTLDPTSPPTPLHESQPRPLILADKYPLYEAGEPVPWVRTQRIAWWRSRAQPGKIARWASPQSLSEPDPKMYRSPSKKKSAHGAGRIALLWRTSQPTMSKHEKSSTLGSTLQPGSSLGEVVLNHPLSEYPQLVFSRVELFSASPMQ